MGWRAAPARHRFGATIVTRQDSGDPTQVVLKTVQVAGQWRDVFKDLVTDPSKRSKAWRRRLLQKEHAFATVRLACPAYAEHLEEGWHEALRTVFENGRLLIDDRLAQIRHCAS